MARGVLRFALLALCAGVAVASSAAPPPLRVLFVGNSLTSANDLPGAVEAISRRGGGERAIETETLAEPDFALEDHWRSGRARKRIERGHFDVVVLQQGPSSLPESRANLVEWTTRFSTIIRAAGARPALLTVWPAESRSADFDRVVASYAAAAESVDGLLLPAGLAWRHAWALDRGLDFYGPDRFHPAPLGTHLAALVVEAALTGRTPYAEASRAELLAQAAARALGDRLAVGVDLVGCRDLVDRDCGRLPNFRFEYRWESQAQLAGRLQGQTVGAGVASDSLVWSPAQSDAQGHAELPRPPDMTGVNLLHVRLKQPGWDWFTFPGPVHPGALEGANAFELQPDQRFVRLTLVRVG
jgi:hypothetical protein